LNLMNTVLYVEQNKIKRWQSFTQSRWQCQQKLEKEIKIMNDTLI